MTTSVWMGDLEPYMDEEFIKNAFNTMGESVVNIKLVSDKIPRGKAGYCFVDLVDEASVERCLHRLNGVFMPCSNPPRKFKLNYSTYHKKLEAGPDFTIFVGDLSPEVDDFQLYYYFLKKYPSCRGGKVVTDVLGYSKGYGFVKFGDENEQKKALRECHFKRGLGEKAIRISSAIPRRLKAEGQPTSNVDYSYYYQQCQNYYTTMGYDPYSTYPSGYEGYDATTAYPNETLEGNPEIAQAGSEGPLNVVDYEFEEHIDTLDTEMLNRVYMTRSEELFDSLMNCHWQPLDTVTSEIPSTV